MTMSESSNPASPPCTLLTRRSGTSSEEFASLMKVGLPELQELYLASDDDFSAGVASAFAILESSPSTNGSET